MSIKSKEMMKYRDNFENSFISHEDLLIQKGQYYKNKHEE